MAEEKKPLTREDVEAKIKEHGGPQGLDLSGETFEAGIDLSDFNLELIILENARFAVKFERGDTEADIGAQLQKAKLMRANLKGTSLRFADLQKTNLSNANLQGANLSDAHLEGARLYRAQFDNTTNFQGVSWGNHKIGEEIDCEFKLAVDAYRRLKVWYTQSGYHDTAAKFYYREKEAGRKALGWTWKLLHHRIALELLRALFGYGEDWKRVLYWMALVVFGSTAAYYLSGELSLPYSLYFSVISFTALGYGEWVDITPQGWVQALGAFQSFTGVFLMALLLVTFFRKWTR